MASVRFCVVEIFKNGMRRMRTQSVSLAVKILSAQLTNRTTSGCRAYNFRSRFCSSSPWFYPRISQLKVGGKFLYPPHPIIFSAAKHEFFRFPPGVHCSKQILGLLNFSRRVCALANNTIPPEGCEFPRHAVIGSVHNLAQPKDPAPPEALLIGYSMYSHFSPPFLPCSI